MKNPSSLSQAGVMFASWGLSLAWRWRGNRRKHSECLHRAHCPGGQLAQYDALQVAIHPRTSINPDARHALSSPATASASDSESFRQMA